MKTKYNPSYRSYLAYNKRKRYESFLDWIRETYVNKNMFLECGSPTSGRIRGKSYTCAIVDELL